MKKLLFTVALCGALALPAVTDKTSGKAAESSCCMAAGATKKTAKGLCKTACLEKTAVFAVSNMSCEGCSGALQSGLAKEKGVCDVKVDFASKRATLHYNARQTSAKKLKAAFGRKGFPAKLVSAK